VQSPEDATIDEDLIQTQTYVTADVDMADNTADEEALSDSLLP
jgi:hypothetical protein